MDDSEVVKVLAEFMGIRGRIVGNLTFDPNGVLPDYLTSYDAIAEVWRHAATVSLGGHVTLAEKAQVALLGIDVNHELIGDWWMKSPRDHAYALAKAIQSVKGE